jgi:glycosyltransferase involved in cell wall biosynthesis
VAKIVLIDASHTGHHISYARTLMKCLKESGHTVVAIGNPLWLAAIRDIADSTISVTQIEYKLKSMSGEMAKIRFFRQSMAAAQAVSPDIIHLLWLDHYLLAAACTLPRSKVQIRATLHWGYLLPEFSLTPFQKAKNRVERWLLGRFARQGMNIMVHSVSLRKRLMATLDTENVDFVPYPIEPMPAVDRKAAREFVEAKTGLSQGDRIILLFGDVRHYKGTDIAMEALRQLPSHYHLLVAGNPGDESRESIQALAKRLGIENRLHLQLHFISDNEVPLYFTGSDIALIPYRKTFSGQSGPLVIAATLGVPVAAANLLVLAETINKYELGTVFNPEDPADMAVALTTLQHYRTSRARTSFIDDHNENRFLASVQNSYSARSSERRATEAMS